MRAVGEREATARPCNERWTGATLDHARAVAASLRVSRAPKVYLPFNCQVCGFYHIERQRDLEKD